MQEIIARGYNRTITLNENGVHIKPGVMGQVFKGGRFRSKQN